MIASLPMYWRPETAGMWHAFWAEVQRASPELDLPDLTPPEDIPDPWTDHWLRDDLALSATCGLPFRDALKDRVTYIGTLDYGLDGPAGSYHSVVIRPVPASDDPTPPEGLRLACNQPDSHSGWAVTQHAAPFGAPPRFAEVIETGSHAASLAALAEGRADIAYIDAITWRLLARYDPAAEQMHVHGQSIVTPGHALIAAKGTDPAPLRRALTTAVQSFTPDDPMAMGGPLSFHILDPQDYYAVPIPKPPAA